ncbi:unnamed protein product [Schistosoma mattheei]|uniref:Uncharacterized protein n=1 Tax=Schistosoma mattheei TaxID=31246 RepID=A0A3P8BDE3_9TREM|nr:unnamed protein product [Schistosoma mattheei]
MAFRIGFVGSIELDKVDRKPKDDGSAPLFIAASSISIDNR